MSMKLCLRCGLALKSGQDVKLTVYAKYKELKTTVLWSIETPYSADEDTLRHVDCPIPRND